MHWQAFDARAAVTRLVGDRPESLLWHAGRIFVGHQGGGLSVYEVGSSGEGTLAHYSKTFTKKTVEQLAVIKETNSLVALSDGNITLCDLHTFAVQTVLPQTRTQASIFAIDTSVQSLPSNRPSSSRAPRGSPGIPTLCTTLVVGCKRRLIIYRWRDSEWTEPQELSLPHQTRSLTFPTPTTVILGYSTSSYGIVTLPSSASSEAATLAELQVPTLAAAAATLPVNPAQAGGGLGLPGLDRLGGLAMKTTGYMGIAGIGRVARNDVLSIGGGETLVVRDALGTLLTSDGKLARPRGGAIEYPATPDAVVFSPPYIVSLFPPGAIAQPATTGKAPAPPQNATLLVHSSSESLSEVQSIPVPPLPPPPSQPSLDYRPPDQPHVARLLTATPTSASAGGGKTVPLLLVTTSPAPSTEGSTIWMVSMRSWEAQLVDMESRGEYTEALRLLGDSRADVVISNKASRRLRLRQLCAVTDNFIAKKEYDPAIDEFIDLETTPAKVVSLYPESIAGRLYRDPPEAREAVFGGRSVATIVEKLRSPSTEPPIAIKAGQSSDTHPGNLSSSPARPQSIVVSPDNSDAASIRSVRPAKSRSQLRHVSTSSPMAAKDDSPPASATSATAAEEHAAQLDFRKSVEALVRYLTDRRQHVAKALSNLRPGTRPSPSTPLVPAPTAEELLALPDVPLSQLAPAQLHRVAQVVDTALFKCYLATRPALLGPLCRLDNWCEIEEIEGLLSNAKRYRELLDLYHGKNSHEKAIALLRQMSESEMDAEDKVEPTVRYLQKLGSNHLDLIFDASKWVFEVDRKIGLEIFVADYKEVESLPRHAVMRHLDGIGPDVCRAYIEHIIHDLGEDGPEFHEKLIELYLADVRSTKDEGQKGGTYERLIDFLETSTQYRADRLLGRLPNETMYEVRAVLLGRLGQHEGALQIYVNRLKDYATAEDYCQRIFAVAPDDDGGIFLILLRIYLRPRLPSTTILFEPALALLSHHGRQIDLAAVLDLLPPLVTAHDVDAFLAKALRRMMELRRSARVERDVYRAATDGMDLELVTLNERRVKVTPERLCPQCTKRLGNSVLAVLQPRGETVHYSCMQKALQNMHDYGS